MTSPVEGAARASVAVADPTTGDPSDADPPGVDPARAEPSLFDAADVARALGCDSDKGLSDDEAARRLATDGPNELRAAPPVPGWRRVLAQFHDPLVYLLMVAIAISALAWMVEGAQGWPVDAIVIGLIVLLNAVLGFVQEAKAENAVAALARMTAATSTVMRAGVVRQLPSAELVRGDLLLLGEGDAIGADARLLSSAGLLVQEASLTGESEAVDKNPKTLAEAAALGDRHNMVFKGTAVVQGSGRAVVTATAMATQMGSIAGLLESATEAPTPLQQEIARIGRMLGVAVVLIAAAVVGTLLMLSEIDGIADLIPILLLGVSLAVAAVPEGLPAILTVVLALGIQRMAKHNAIVKKLSSVETLGSASVICSDKTGTLTRSEMTVKRILTASGAADVSGVGYSPQGEIETETGEKPAAAQQTEIQRVLEGGSLAGNAGLQEREPGVWEIRGDPTEAAFLVAERKLGTTDERERRFSREREIPFNSERKMMSSVEIDHEDHDRAVLFSKGAPDVLLDHCSRIQLGTDSVELDAERKARVLADIDRLSDDAMRTLAVAWRPLANADAPGAASHPAHADALESDLIYAGTVGIIDPPREEAGEAIREAHGAGIRVVMITGDHPRTAARIAAELGIIGSDVADVSSAALSGEELDAMNAQQFAEAVRTTSVYARVAPAHKMRIVDALQADGEIVAMTGDGVNDAPALKSADIGIAMGLTGTEVTRQAAKMILADDNFATIVVAVREGRGIFDNIRKFLRYLLSSNMGEVLTVFLGVVAAGLIGLSDGSGAVVLPLLATQILWVNLVTDSGPALAIGVDPIDEDLMARNPRKAGERVIDGAMWADVIEVGLVMAIVTLLTIDLYLPGGLLEGSRELDNARTAGFTVLVLAQLFNALAARSERSSAFRHLATNGWLWGAIALSALLQVAVVHIGILNLAFGTVPLDLGQWLVCLAMSSAVLWVSELRKLIVRSWRGRERLGR